MQMWKEIIIPIARGIAYGESPRIVREEANAMGGQNMTGENMAASMWNVVLASTPSSVLSQKYQAIDAWMPVENNEIGAVANTIMVPIINLDQFVREDSPS